MIGKDLFCLHNNITTKIIVIFGFILSTIMNIILYIYVQIKNCYHSSLDTSKFGKITYIVLCTFFIISSIIWTVIIILQSTKYCINLNNIIMDIGTLFYEYGIIHEYLFFYLRLRYTFSFMDQLKLSKLTNIMLIGSYIIMILVCLFAFIGHYKYVFI